MISHQYRFIYFHIPRTAGTSIEDALWRYRDHNQKGPHPQDHPDYYGRYDWHLYGFHQENFGDGSNNVKHVGDRIYEYASNLLAEDSQPHSYNYGVEKFESYFKFTFVRNPWDRFISLWFKFKEEPILQNQFNTLYELSPYCDFDDMESVLRYLWLSSKKELLLPFWFKPQYEFIHDSNLRILTNYVGAYEKLQFCFDFLCDRIDFPKKELPWSEDKHRRKEKDKKHYTEFYEKRTENMIRDVYKEDIRTWGYEFGD